MPNYRMPNGYGGVVKLSGRRRNPYCARKTVGYDDRAYPIYDVIGYYPTRREALDALSAYNADPYDIDLSKSTLKEVYDAWSKETVMKTQMASSMQAAFGHCKELQDRPYKSLRRIHMQSCIDKCNKGYSTRSNIKTLFGKLDDYAYDHDIISKRYSRTLEIGEKEQSTKHTLFTDKEVQEIWKHQGEPVFDEVLFMLYCGCRISEMLRIRTENVNLENRTIVLGVKTRAGIDRTVPIHDKILPIVKQHYNQDHQFLFQHDSKQDTQRFSNQYLHVWSNTLKTIGINHLSHDCRYTVRSKLDSAGANKVCIDRIIGHASGNTGEQVYTIKTVEELHEAIKKLNYDSLTK